MRCYTRYPFHNHEKCAEHQMVISRAVAAPSQNGRVKTLFVCSLFGCVPVYAVNKDVYHRDTTVEHHATGTVET